MPQDDVFNPGNRLVSYDRDPDAPIEEDLLIAFDLSPLQYQDEDTVLHDYVDADALADLRWDTGDIEVRTEIWGYPVRITADEINIYSPDTGSTYV